MNNLLASLHLVVLLLSTLAVAWSSEHSSIHNIIFGNNHTTQINQFLSGLGRRQSNITYVQSNPIDVHVNVGQEGTFTVFVGPYTAQLERLNISFKCVTTVCHTFDITDLQPIVIDPSTNQTKVEVRFKATTAGHDIILLVFDNQPEIKISNEYAFVRVRVGKSNFLTILSAVFGWIYFFTWSASFWPQNISNFKRKSVVGLNFDYTILHFTGFLFYSIFNMSLYFSSVVQEEYEKKFPRSEIPVELNDVVYSIHAAVVTSITWSQCFIYETGGQRLSIYGKLFQICTWSVGSVLLVLSIFEVITWLTFIYYFSYIKLVVTGVKYLPQVYFNFLRKSTAGWSIYMIYLDILGGSMSMLQMLSIAYNYNDWTTLLGNLPKLGLSIASVVYDIIFLLQEFVFFPQAKKTDCKKPSLAGISGGILRSSLKETSDSHDQLCRNNPYIPSLESSISSKTSSDENSCSSAIAVETDRRNRPE